MGSTVGVCVGVNDGTSVVVGVRVVGSSVGVCEGTAVGAKVGRSVGL